MLYARKINDNAWFVGPSLDSDAVSELGLLTTHCLCGNCPMISTT